jgi:hypothetical protein
MSRTVSRVSEPSPPPPQGPPGSFRLAALVSLALLGLRFHLASQVGFGDAEALYASYALHPQPAYLDHPGLLGAIARFLGDGGAPTPVVVHRCTAFAATLVPWLGFLAARAGGAAPNRALRTFFALALLPEMSIGLFALTPDLPLAALWLTTLGAAALSLRSAPGSRTALFGAMAAGFAAGLSVHAKASGVLLVFCLAAAFGTKRGRGHLRTPAPWFGLGVLLVLLWPLLMWERQEGWPLLAHRFVATQARAGFSLRNVGALLGGQLLYVTPPFLLGAWRVFRALQSRTDKKTRDHDVGPGDADTATNQLLLFATVIPAVALGLLCLWSRVAEPHWVAPAYLALAIGASRFDTGGLAFDRVCLGTGLLAVVATFVLVTTPILPQLSGPGYVPRYDLVNDLYAWKSAIPLVTDELFAAEAQSQATVVVGPHWTVCGQVHAALGVKVKVGCLTPEGDDFSRWLPRKEWSRSPTLLFVTDDRFTAEPATTFPDRDVVSVRTVHVYRGGRRVRSIRVARLDHRGLATLLGGLSTERARTILGGPASRIRAASDSLE